MHCNKCGTENPDGYNFCRACETRLADTGDGEIPRQLPRGLKILGGVLLITIGAAILITTWNGPAPTGERNWVSIGATGLTIISFLSYFAKGCSGVDGRFRHQEVITGRFVSMGGEASRNAP